MKKNKNIFNVLHLLSLLLLFSCTNKESDLLVSEGIVKPDIEITLTWNTSNSDVDLHVINPLGEHCFWDELVISDGFINSDDSLGFGPETFISENATNGIYSVLINNYNLNSDPYTDATVKIKLNGKEESFGPHRFSVFDYNGYYEKKVEAWWEVYSFEYNNGNISKSIAKISNNQVKDIIMNIEKKLKLN